MLTPNQFELELLSGRAVAAEADAAAACAALHARGPRVVVVTSLDLAADHPNHVAMLASAVDDGGGEGGGGAGAGAVRQWRLLLPKVEAMHFTGTGDLMAALLLAWTHRHPGADGVAIAMEKAGATMQAVLKRTVERSRERAAAAARGRAAARMAAAARAAAAAAAATRRRGGSSRCSTRSGRSRSRRWRCARWRSRTCEVIE